MAKNNKVYAIIFLLFIEESIIKGRMMVINIQNNKLVIPISTFCMEDKFK